MNEARATLEYIALNVRKFRKDRDLTLDDLAAISKVHKNYLSRLENGDANISVNKLVSICNALNVHIADVLPPKHTVLNGTSPIENGQFVSEVLSKLTSLYKRNPYFFNELIEAVTEKEDTHLRMLHEILNLSTNLSEKDLLIIIRLLSGLNRLEDTESSEIDL